MNSITASSLAKSALGNPITSSLLALAVWIVGVMSGSVPAIIVSGLLAYGYPIFYVALLNSEDKAEKSSKTGYSGLSSIRPSAVGVR